ncbi:hypothetical protein JG688_00017729 [Phytophthora aleatoria]|uniref:Uncharacterized protein n=1 Tax=Phytophthora aleatoria TaxID=2496075 RepID=A0A8J5IGZ9_9STRA|nr:hypothetical protein JG688_00017729 [Phytophthora aleatoria]
MLPPLPTRLYWQCCSDCWCSPGALYTDQTGEFDWSAGNLGRAHAVAFGSSVGRDLHSVVARGTARTVNVASDERSRCLESKPAEVTAKVTVTLLPLVVLKWKVGHAATTMG